MKFHIFIGSSFNHLAVYGSGVDVRHDGEFVDVIGLDGKEKFPIDFVKNPARYITDNTGEVVWAMTPEERIAHGNAYKPIKEADNG